LAEASYAYAITPHGKAASFRPRSRINFVDTKL